MFRVRSLALVLLLLGPAPLSAGPLRGVVFVAGGVGGLDPLQVWAPLAFSWAEVPHEVRVFEWTHGICRPIKDLRDRAHLLAQAKLLADAVTAVKTQAPERPVYLVGHSAGAGLVLAAAEQLPPGSIERIVLLSAAVSPTYDLRPALRSTRGEIVSFHSSHDRLLLDWGTSLFGTVDRLYGPAAGLKGFVRPEQLDEEGRRLYARLVEVPWAWKRLLEWHGGWHHSTTMPAFLAVQVAPRLKPNLPGLENGPQMR
jgi:pimeloyl-ACP methyl ester carboxylesterase